MSEDALARLAQAFVPAHPAMSELGHPYRVSSYWRRYQTSTLAMEGVEHLDDLEEETGGFRVADNAVRAKARGGMLQMTHAVMQPTRGVLKMRPREELVERWLVHSQSVEDGPWHLQGDFSTFREARERFLRLQRGTLVSHLFGLSAVERLEGKLQ